MHMFLVTTGGVLLLGVFTLFGKLWGGDFSGVVAGAKLFIPVWFVIALMNMWVGVTRAGYTVVQELPILLVVFAIPAVAAIAIWQVTGSNPAHFPSLQQERTNMSIDLPPALQSAINAINSGDEEAFVAAFSPDGLINDWGRVLTGHDGVRSWARSDAIGAGAIMTVTTAATTDNTTHIVFDWKSRVFNGRSEAYVTIPDKLIMEFRIPSK